MNVLKYQISLENKKLNNLLISKTLFNTPLVYESAYYILVYNNEELIGISKNYFFNYPEDTYIFKDSVLKDLKDLKDLNSSFKNVGINYSLWIKPEYRSLSIGHELFKRTLVEFNIRQIQNIYVVAKEDKNNFYSSIIGTEATPLNTFFDNEEKYKIIKFKLSEA